VGWRVEVGLDGVGVCWESEQARLRVPNIKHSGVKILR
jgi:hypothetical protein